MREHKQGVVEEQRELRGKLFRLRAFIGGEVFKTLPVRDQELLQEQAELMGGYEHVLRERTVRFENVGVI